MALGGSIVIFRGGTSRHEETGSPVAQSQEKLESIVEERASQEIAKAQEVDGSWPLRIVTLQVFHPTGKASWEDLNARRINLIDKYLESRLTLAEAAELRALQAEADRRINLPSTGIFEEFEQSVAREGLARRDPAGD